MGPAGLNRRKKTPEEIAAENEAAEQDELTSEYSLIAMRWLEEALLGSRCSWSVWKLRTLLEELQLHAVTAGS